VRALAPPASEAPADRESSPERELIDVPAAVVCMLCGETDCGGCEASDQSRSGIVAIIAWERPGIPMLSRLWSTARSTTRDAEGFFELMPDGPLLPALRFAAACELLAITAFGLVFFGIALVVAPEWVKHLAYDASARGTLRALVLAPPALAGLLVIGHAAHGLSIDIGAKKNGARGARSRALRFGLYACGWDLVTSPLGAIVVAFKEGVRAAAALSSVLSGLPTRSTNAFLRGCYRLDREKAKNALGTSYVGAAIITVAFALIFLAAGLALVLA